jgi:hypothetical protein
MKIFLSYLQITAILKYVTLNLPIWAESASNPNLLDFNIDCALLPFANSSQIPLVYLRYMV